MTSGPDDRRCAGCRTCVAPAAVRAGRTLAAAALHVVSLGMSLLASRAGAHCPRCGHLPSRHVAAVRGRMDPDRHRPRGNPA